MSQIRVGCAALLTALTLAPAARAAVNVGGSAYVDYGYLSSETARRFSQVGVTPEASLKVEVEIHERVSFTAKVCFGCHGFEMDRAQLEYTPSNRLSLAVGRFGVPFGDFSQRYDPSNHRSATKPLIYEMGRMPYYGRSAFNLGVVPIPYVDTGILASGSVPLGASSQLWYGGYVVAGMKGDSDLDYISMRAPYYWDNNKSPAVGGRLVWTLAPLKVGFFKDLSVGASVMHGRYNPQGTRKYLDLGVDAVLRIASLTLRAEAAYSRVDIDPTLTYRFGVIDPFVARGGFYVEAEHPLGRHLLLSARYDILRRVGVPLLEASPQLSPDSSIHRLSASAQVLIGPVFFAKLDYEYAWLTDFPSFHSLRVGLGGAF